MWQQAQDWLKKISGQKSSAPPPSDYVDEVKPCCEQTVVHIAFRGKSDDRMYMTYNRDWKEVRFYQPNGLRVFCSVCRRRVL